MTSTEWMRYGACRGRGHELFYGADGERQPERDEREAKAKQVCAGCPVRTDCLEYAIEQGDRNGMWGGMDGEERHSLDRRIKRRARASA